MQLSVSVNFKTTIRQSIDFFENNCNIVPINWRVMIRSIAVFCGSSMGRHPAYAEEAKQLGEALAEKNITLVYGGGNIGLMGVIANTVLSAGGKVTGIIPAFLNTAERKHEHLTEQIEVKTMHERKALMYERCDAAIVLPGGYGTLDEFFELLTWNQLTLHDKKVGLLNVAGYYDCLYRHFQRMEEERFLRGHFAAAILMAPGARELLRLLLEEKDT